MSDSFGRFFYPGPTDVRAEVLDAMRRPMIPHRGRDFESLFARLQDFRAAGQERLHGESHHLVEHVRLVTRLDRGIRAEGGRYMPLC